MRWEWARGPAALAVASVAAWATTACGSAVVRETGFDEMQFAEDAPADDWAVEAIRPVRPPPRPGSVRRPVGRVEADLSEPVGAASEQRARCDSEKVAMSRSVGAATAGSLEDGCRMPAQGPGWLHVNRNSWGSDETVALLQWAAAQTQRRFPRSAPFVIGALSREGGGRLKPHRSHQAGRDVDIGYPAPDRALRRFEVADAATLDSERLWSFLELLIYTNEVVFVFMDYDLQAALFAQLLENGWTEDALAQIFQYPAGPGVPRGILRHADGHRDHFHVRFRCAQRERETCSD